MPARKGDRFLFSSSDDRAMLKQIEATHAPDDRDFALKPLLQILEDVFHRATPAIQEDLQVGRPQLDALDATALHSSGLDDLLDILARVIHRISCELSYKCYGGGDAHSTTIAILNILANYRWDAKLVLSLAGLAVIYGEFWLNTQLYATNMLAKGVGLLKQLAGVLEQSDALKPKIEAVMKLIQAMLGVTKCVVLFRELPVQHLAHDTPEYLAATAHIPTAVYWTIRSAVACASQIVSLIGFSQEYLASTQESWELLSLAHKLNSILEHLRGQLEHCQKVIGQRQHEEAYQTLKRLFSTPHIDNSKILAALMYDELPLHNGSTKQRVGISVLRRKHVLLLISDLDISDDELWVFKQVYDGSHQKLTNAEGSHRKPVDTESQYEVVWFPIVDRLTPWTNEKEEEFHRLQEKMLWYSIHHPSLIDPAVIKYVKEDWQFKMKPILVVLDPQGKIVNENAMHMLWIWGSVAFPFTTAREEALWREQTWNIELLMDDLEPEIFTWIEEGKYVCLYGGENMEWIRALTKTVSNVAKEAGIHLEILYTGKSNPKERIKKNVSTIRSENLSHTLQEPTYFWLFWVRLESMWHSKMKYSKRSDPESDDPTMHAIMTMLTFDGSDQGWVLICWGPTVIAQAKGDTMLRCLDQYPEWRDSVPEKGFVPAINGHLEKIQSPHHCNRLILPGTAAGIPERVVCAECGRNMEKFVMYRCCID